MTSLPTQKREIWRGPGGVLAIFFAVGLPLWPFLSFGAIFIFDSPIQSRTDLVHRYTVAYFIWFYPITYGVTFLAYYILQKCGVSRWTSCLAWGLPVGAYFILLAFLTWRGADSNPKRIQLLYRTDPVALLAACREVMANRKMFPAESDDPDRAMINPKDSRLPAAILALQPLDVVAEDNEVYLDLHEGFDRYGVDAFSEKSDRSHTNQWGGDILLTPGLWFCDDELTYQGTDRTEYINQLKALKPADARTPGW